MKSTLLFADADGDLCDLFEICLKENGFGVETASDGLDCIRQLRQMTPTAIILDVNLRWGGSDGILAWLREEELLRDIPVILTGTSDDPCGTANFNGPPVVAYLVKPFTLATLEESLRTAVAMGGHKMPSPPNRTRVFSDLVMV